MATQEVHNSCTTAAVAIVVQVGPDEELCLLDAASAAAASCCNAGSCVSRYHSDRIG